MPVAIIGPKFYAWDNDTGKPLAFGKVFTYQSGTNTPKATFTTEGGETQNANPTILNGAGYADIFLSGSYKIVVKDADDVKVWTSDPVSDPSQLQQEWVRQRNITQVNTTTFTVDGELTDEYVEGVAVRVKQDSGFVFGNVASATYATGTTTVTLDMLDGATLTTSAIYAERAIVTSKSLPASIQSQLDKRTIYVGSVAEIEALSLPVGTNVYLTQDGSAGEFVVKTGTPPSDPQKGIYIVLANGNYAERTEKEPINTSWFDDGSNISVIVQSAVNIAKLTSLKKVIVPDPSTGVYSANATIIVDVAGLVIEMLGNSSVFQKSFYTGSVLGEGCIFDVRAPQVKFVNLGIDGQGDLFNGGGVVVRDAPTFSTFDITFENPRIRDTKDSGIILDGDRSAAGLRVNGGFITPYNAAGTSGASYPGIRKINAADSDASPRHVTDVMSSSSPLIDVTGMVTTFLKGGQCSSVLFGGNPDVTGATFISAKTSAVGVRARDGFLVKGEDHSFSACTINSVALDYSVYGGTPTPLSNGLIFDSTATNCSADPSNIVPDGIRDNANGLGDIGNKFFSVAIPYNLNWTATTTNPSIGNGTISANYRVYYKTVKVSVSITMGSTTTFGDGSYRFSVPKQINGNILAYGHCRVFNAGVNGNEWGRVQTASSGLPSTVEIAVLDGSVFSPASPHTFKDGDRIDFTFEYERL